MPSKNFWILLPTALLLTAALSAQMAPTLTVAPVPTVKVKKGGSVVVSLKASLPAGYHANSNKPTEAYLIPLTLKWTGGPLQLETISYPKPTMEKYSFSEKPLSVVTGEFAIATTFKAPADAQSGPASQTGTLRYQACDNRACYPPKNVPVSVVVSVE
jgi:hypothetical protein